MVNNNSIYEEMDEIKQCLAQIDREYPQVSTVLPGGEISPKQKVRPPEIDRKYKKLRARLEELKKQDDKEVMGR